MPAEAPRWLLHAVRGGLVPLPAAAPASAHRPRWAPAPLPPAGGRPAGRPKVTPADPAPGRASVAGWSFMDTPSVLPALVADVFAVEVRLDHSGFQIGGRTVAPRTFASMIAGARPGRPVLLLPNGPRPAGPALDMLVGAVCDALDQTVTVADDLLWCTVSGLIRTDGTFRRFHPRRDTPGRRVEMLGSVLPKPVRGVGRPPVPVLVDEKPMDDGATAVPVGPEWAKLLDPARFAVPAATDYEPVEPAWKPEPAPAPVSIRASAPVRAAGSARVPAAAAVPVPLADEPTMVPLARIAAALGTASVPAPAEPAPEIAQPAVAAVAAPVEVATAEPVEVATVEVATIEPEPQPQAEPEPEPAPVIAEPASPEPADRPGDTEIPHGDADSALWLPDDEPDDEALTADRNALRQVLGVRYDSHARIVTRTLSERPGMRAGAGTTAGISAGLVAVRAYLLDSRDDVNAVLRGAKAHRDDDHVPLLARTARYGLQRLPAVFGPVFGTLPGARATAALYQPGEELVEPAFLDVGLTPAATGVAEVEFAIWSVSAHRLAGIGTDDNAALFPPGSRFAVLAVDQPEDDEQPVRVLLRDLAVSPARRTGRAGAGQGPDGVLSRLREVTRPARTKRPPRPRLTFPIGLDARGRRYRRSGPDRTKESGRA
jgi:YD repeat-containing protein